MARQLSAAHLWGEMLVSSTAITFRRLFQVIALALLFVVLLTAVVPVFGQSCALCYTQAASSGSRMIRALRNGILILVIPPMFLSVGFTVLAYRKRNQFRRTDELGNPIRFAPKERSHWAGTTYEQRTQTINTRRQLDS